MTHTYNITGLTCSGCVAKAKNELLKLGDVSSAEVQLTAPQATISMQNHVPLQVMQKALSKAGNYTITEADGGMKRAASQEDEKSWVSTYKPILVIGAYITGITLLLETSARGFNLESWMQNFMAAFFLVFSFFKLLDLKGFAESYATYDIIANKWSGWGYLYAFIELALGIAYLLKFQPLLTNTVTFVVMGISILGVVQSVLNKRKIKCACLGAVFNLPMSNVTAIEDASMIAMSAVMIVTMI
jgi:copper chaperone CopZ